MIVELLLVEAINFSERWEWREMVISAIFGKSETPYGRGGLLKDSAAEIDLFMRYADGFGKSLKSSYI